MHRINKTMLLSMVGFAFCFSACQKKPETPIVKQSLNIVDQPINYGMDLKPFGLINQSDAEALFKAYHLSHPNDSETQFVAFKIKDLIAYLNILSKKNQSDEVYVTFGQYSKQTSNDLNKIGRTTIFFSGNTAFQNKIHSKSSTDLLEYLNHGQLYP